MKTCVCFTFRMNQSFLYSGHQLQIPRRQVNYDDLRALSLNHQDIQVVLPHGERYRGWLYHHGLNQHLEYYQLHLSDRHVKFPDYLKLDERLVLVLLRTNGKSLALIEYLS